MELNTNDAYGVKTDSSKETKETEICANSTPIVEGQHVYVFMNTSMITWLL